MDKKGQVIPAGQVEQPRTGNRLLPIIIIVLILLVIGGVLAYILIGNGQPVTNNKSQISKNLTPTNAAEKTTLTEIRTLDITPPETSTVWKADSVMINGNFYVAYRNPKKQIYEVVGYDENFNRIMDPAEIKSFESGVDDAMDLRITKDSDNNILFASQGKALKPPQQLQCGDTYLGAGKFDIITKQTVNFNYNLTNGCPGTTYDIQNGIARTGDKLVDDPSPFFYNNQYYVSARTFQGYRQYVYVLNDNIDIEDSFILDLTNRVSNLGNYFTQNSFVDIAGKIYIIGGLSSDNNKKGIYAIPLTADLRQASGNAIKLVDPTANFVVSAKYDDGKLYITYRLEGIHSNADTAWGPGYLEVFDVSDNFKSIAKININNNVDYNHFTVEVKGNNVYVFHEDENSKLIVTELAWK